jgi:hypothetical protein
VCVCVHALLFVCSLACAECDDSLPFSGASAFPLYYVLFPATLFRQLFVYTLPPHLAICILVYLSFLSFSYSCIVLFWEFSFLPFSLHVQTNVICLTLLCVIVGFLTLSYISVLVNIFQCSLTLSYTGPKILLYTFHSKMFNCLLSLFVSV